MISTSSPNPKLFVRPRQLVWRGVVEARALWFDNALHDETTIRQRVLVAWQNGSIVHRFPNGLLLLWPSAQRVVCEHSLGAPLVAELSVLVASPLSENEKAQIFDEQKSGNTRSLSRDVSPQTLITIRQGRAHLRNLSEATIEDLSHWLDTTSFHFEGAQSLGAVPQALALVTETEFDARQALTHQDAAPELQRVLEVLRGEKNDAKTDEGEGKEARGISWPQLPALTGLAGSIWNAVDGVRPWQRVRDGSQPVPLVLWWALFALVNWFLGGNLWTFFLAVFAFWVLREIMPATWVQLNATPVSSQPATPQLATPKPKKPSTNSFMSGLARAVMMSRLAGLIGRKHARYIGQMMEMFERGDWDAALRHAVPLGSGGPGADNNPFLGRLMARPNLQISAHSAMSSSSINLGEELSTKLRALYRRAFESLKERDRIEEAAFVLAELLENNEEAVAFLESHDRKRLAAEMAEARNLPAGLVVRQWFIAGDEARAIAVARKHNAWADAVLRLEQKGDERAEYLRVLWARTLAHSGQYAAAIETLWPIEAMREHARVFAELAIESGGIAAARALARLLEFDAESLHYDNLRGRVLVLLEDEDREGAAARLAFMKTIVSARNNAGNNAATRAAAGIAARTLLRDSNLEFTHAENKTLQRLVEISRDGALRADVPALPVAAKSETLSTRSTPLDIEIAANDSGSTPILDATFLPDGKCVVALGEAGALMLNRDGRVVHRFDEPCHKMVISDNGDRAIALAPRGSAQTGVTTRGEPQISDIYLLSHLDFARKTSRHWCEAALGAFADSYDGSVWFASVERELAMIDALNPKFAALWKGGDTGGTIRSVARSQTHCSLLTYSMGAGQGKIVELHGNVPTTINLENLQQEKCERWTFTLAGAPTLRERTAAPPLFSGMVSPVRSVTASGRVLMNSFSASPDSESTASGQLFRPHGWLGLESRVASTVPFSHGSSDLGPPQVFAAHTDETFIVAPLHDRGGTVCYVADNAALTVRARLDLNGASLISTRFAAQHLLIADNLGRLLVLDLETGLLLRDLRI